MNTMKTAALSIDSRFPNSICFHGLLNMREETRTDLIRYKHSESVAAYAVQNELDPETMVSEHHTMLTEKTDFDSAFAKFFGSENVALEEISYEQLKQFVKLYSIRYSGTITRSAMEKGMRRKGVHVRPSLYRKIDIEIWKSDTDMVLEAYIPSND